MASRYARAPRDSATRAQVRPGGGVAQLRHSPGFDLPDSFAGKTEAEANLLPSPWPPVKAEPEGDDLSPAIPEARQHVRHLVR